MLRLIIIILSAAAISACAKHDVATYEEFFLPIEKPAVIEESGFVPELEIILEPEPKAEQTKSVCKAKAAPGTRKIGKPYVIAGLTYYPLESADGYSEEGVASWYGPGFHGKLTANGEKYSQHDMTAAHKTLPLPTLVRVQNLENGKEIIVRVNDRGPFSKGRIIDLTEEGASRIGMIDKGTARVRVSVLSEDADCYVVSGKEVDLDKGSFAIQIGAFADAGNAERLAARFGGKSAISAALVNGVAVKRVSITGFGSKSDAESSLHLYESEFPGAFVVSR